MNPSVSSWGSTQVAALVARMDLLRRKLEADGLISSWQGGSLSVKTSTEDLFSAPVEALLVQDAACATPVLARLEVLGRLARMAGLAQAERSRELDASRLAAASAVPDDGALLHACLRVHAAVLVTHPAILAVGCNADWRQRAQALFGKETTLLEASGSALFEACAQAQGAAARTLFIRHHGLIVGADDLDQACAAATRLAAAAQADAGPGEGPLEPLPLEPSLRVAVAQYRQTLSQALGAPQLVRLAGRPGPEAAALLAVPGSPSAAHGSQAESLPPAELGLAVHAAHPAELRRQLERLGSDLWIRSAAARRGPLELLPPRTRAAAPAPAGEFSGEVALVTGCATGIGRAAVQSLLERGAAVIGLDIKPEVAGTFQDPGYLGLAVDLTDEPATLRCLERAVHAFGGLDMLVLNAGIFPSSCNLDALSMEHWRKVMQINVDVNITLLREAYPLLKRAPRYGRVVINSSRNVPAPGPGAAAYSASKAALTQLGRVAALEWAASGIRVNLLNPHAVFDTGIWSDEVIQSRASRYGLTPEQYKTNNLLQVQLTSRDVGELVAEMLGPRYAKTTGAQIPVDGGSDRVI